MIIDEGKSIPTVYLSNDEWQKILPIILATLTKLRKPIRMPYEVVVTSGKSTKTIFDKLGIDYYKVRLINVLSGKGRR